MPKACLRVGILLAAGSVLILTSCARPITTNQPVASPNSTPETSLDQLTLEELRSGYRREYRRLNRAKATAHDESGDVDRTGREPTANEEDIQEIQPTYGADLDDHNSVIDQQRLVVDRFQAELERREAWTGVWDIMSSQENE